MIVLTVVSHHGRPVSGLSARFDELGGTIGRAENNQLVLPDDERLVSRVHARVLFRNGGYAVIDNGSNPITINGATIGSGREAPLVPGDELQVGPYVLHVGDGRAAPVSDDPFADLFGDGLAAPAAAPVAPAPTPARAPAAASSWSSPSPSPSRPPPHAPAPTPPAGAYASGRAAAAPRAGGPAALPDDWDPFAADAPAPAGAAPMGSADPLRDLVRAAPQESSLDDLFGLGSGTTIGGDPLSGLGGSGAAAGGHAGAPPAAADPLAGFGAPPVAAPATLGDLGSELNTPMPMPPVAPRAAPAPAPALAPAPVTARAAPPTLPPELAPNVPNVPNAPPRAAPAPMRPAARAPQSPAAAPAMPSGAVFSWDEPGPGQTRIVTTPGLRRLTPPPGGGSPAAARPAPAATDDGLPTEGPHVRAPGGAPATSSDALLQALLDGLATPDVRLHALTPDTMRLIGQLLREATRGSVELLAARAALKREMRADVTMIGAQKNNPLKFSPTVEAALQHLLGPPVPGFMAPAPAMRDAFDDLRAHQLGVMAGMRAALEGVLGRFDPARLESQLAQRGGGLSALLPSGRKARLWELFQQLFAQLQREAQDDFDELFGKAFLRAYEAQLDRLGDEPGPR